MNKGNGSVNSIISLLEEISFGDHYFEMAILFRNSMLINSFFCSSEVLYGVKLRHIQLLENCDKSLLTMLFAFPASCSYEAVFLETGILPVRFILQGRRLLYYWTLLNKNDNELVNKVFDIQKQHSVQDDFTQQILEDKNYLGIERLEQDITAMKKDLFKKYVKEKLESKANEFLMNLKENHSKTKNLTNFSLQPYLISEKFTTKEKQLLFSLAP